MPSSSRGRSAEGTWNHAASARSRSHRSHRSSSRGTTCGTLAPPSAHQKWSARRSLHFAKSKLNLVNNPVQTDNEEVGAEAGPSHGWDGGSQRHISRDPSRHPSRNTSRDASRHVSQSVSTSKSEELVKDTGNNDGKEEPLQFHRRESASMSELFYDLWFVANLNVFTTVHPITEADTLASFVGYFLLLWITWFITTVYDARYGQDGILERIANACHLAVMIGFAIVGVSFSEDELIKPIFRATSLFLMLSRLVLAAQYGVVLFHARHHRRSRNSLMLATVLHFLPAVAYCVVAFVSSGHPDKRLFWIWYAVGIVEMGAVILHSTFSKTLSFEGTHVNERLNLLTLIILGEGVIILTKNITKIVEYTFIKHTENSWSPALVGVIICSAATLYITFQLYFDWMHCHNIMKAAQQAYWSIIHLPFHVALVLLSDGGSQWDVWWRAIESFRDARLQLHAAIDKEAMKPFDTSVIIDSMREKAYDLLDKYGVDVSEGGSDAKSLDEAFGVLKQLPDNFWESGRTNASDPSNHDYITGTATVLSTVMNAISDAFDISVEDKTTKIAKTEFDSAELEAVDRTAQRMLLILVYMFLSAGLVLILLMLMHLLSKRRGWSLFNMLRTLTVFAVGIGLSLVALLATNDTLANNYLKTPWQLPTITISYMFILVLTHLPHPPRIFIKRSELDVVTEVGSETDAVSEELPSPVPNNGLSASSSWRPTDESQDRLSQARNKQSLQIRRGIRNMGNIRIERPVADPVAERDEVFLQATSMARSPLARTPLTPLRASFYRV